MFKKASIVMSVIMLMSLIITAITPADTVTAESNKTAEYLEGVSCYKQSMIRIEGSKTIYFDPFAVDGNPKDGDIVFITHTHGDHYSAAEVKKVLKTGGTLVITADGAEQAKKDGFKKLVTVTPGRSYKVKGVTFSTVAAYNTNKDFHKKESKWVGYIVSINDKKYYIAGDTDVIPEMKKIKADVAFLPVGGTYTMTSDEAATAANTIKPKVAVPVHFGDVVGTTSDARNFISKLKSTITGVVLKDLLTGISHMKQSTIRIAADKVIYIDPYNIEGEPKDADFVFISHTHGDHYSPQDIKKVMKDSTKLILPPDAEASAKQEGFNNIMTVKPQESYTADGLEFSTVPAYNTNKAYHTKDSNWVGYILNINKTLYYFAGDTDIIPEMKDIDADVAFLPVGGTYTMTAKEAATAAGIIKPLTAVPIHFADVVGTFEDAETFVSLLPASVKGVILKAK